MKREFIYARKKSQKKIRICMFDNCQSIAIKSHVLQKNGILREISENNHLIELSPFNPFEMDDKGISNIKLVGLNNVFTFHGFCQKHDTDIFKPIEIDSELNFENKNHQALFCYRGLCQEIRRKEIALEWINDLLNFFPKELKGLVNSLADGYVDGLKNLNYFKAELEKSIKSHNYDTFFFDTIKISRLDLCELVGKNWTID